MVRKSLLALVLSLLTAGAAAADDFATRFVLEGQVRSRPATAIAANDWSIGGETVDRGFSNPDNWLRYLGPLGPKRVRLQSGWARTDAGGGRLDFAWLDGIVAGARAQGVAPWISLGYGNPAYIGGGTPQRDSALPSGAGRTAWLAYVAATVARYQGQVVEWEVWNEPDLSGNYTAADYGRFALDTARAIRAADPRAYIILGAFAHQVAVPPDFAETALRTFVDGGGKGLAQAVTYHAYAENPDTSYPGIERFRTMVRGVDSGLGVRQGENGAPSLNAPLFALKNMWWTEESQAKWLLRRMLGDAAHGIPTSMFTIADLDYDVRVENNALFAKTASQRQAPWARNMKGLLEITANAGGSATVRPKTAYRAMQNVTAIFDARLKPVDGGCTVTGGSGAVTAQAFRRDDGLTVLALWRSSDRPGDRPLHEDVDVSCDGVRYGAALAYVDLLTGAVYRVAGPQQGGIVTGVPIYDSPVLLADAAAIPR